MKNLIRGKGVSQKLTKPDKGGRRVRGSKKCQFYMTSFMDDPLFMHLDMKAQEDQSGELM